MSKFKTQKQRELFTRSEYLLSHIKKPLTEFYEIVRDTKTGFHDLSNLTLLLHDLVIAGDLLYTPVIDGSFKTPAFSLPQ